MTSYFPNSEAIEKEQGDKKVQGYIQLEAGWLSQLSMINTPERVASIKAEALAAQLIWENESMLISMKDQGITETGKRFFVMSEHYSEWGPWHDFYIKPGMLQELTDYLDNNLEAAMARISYKEEAEATRRELAERRTKALEKKPQHPEGACSSQENQCEPSGGTDTESVATLRVAIQESSSESSVFKKIDGPSTIKESAKENRESWLPFHLLISVPALLFLSALTIKFFRGHHSPSISDVAIILVLSYSPLRYVFGRGVENVPSQLNHLLKVAVASFILMFLFTQCSTGPTPSESCFYRAGCI